MGITKFTLYIDTLCVLDEMDDRQAGKLFKAIKAYWLRKAERCQQDAGTGFDSLMEDFVTRIAFAPFKAQFERESRSYDEAVGKNMANGKKGGRPKKTQINPLGFSETQENPNNPLGFSFNTKTKTKTKKNKLSPIVDNLQKKDDGDAESQGEAVSEIKGDPPSGLTVPAAQEEKKVAPKKEEAGGASVQAPADAPLGTEEIIAEIEGREITAEQLAMLNGLSPEQWRQAKAEIFTQWRFEGYSRTLRDALNHFANLVRKKAEAIRGKPVPKDRERDFDTMLAGMLATARSPEQQQADEERFKQDFGL